MVCVLHIVTHTYAKTAYIPQYAALQKYNGILDFLISDWLVHLNILIISLVEDFYYGGSLRRPGDPAL